MIIPAEGEAGIRPVVDADAGEWSSMRRMRYKPSKPVAVLTVFFGIGMLYFGISNFRDAEGGAQGFLVFWCLAVVAIVGLNVWAAFSKNGSLATFMPVGSDGEETGGRSESR